MSSQKSILDIENIESNHVSIACQGSNVKIIQSILDFDFLSGKNHPSVVCILSSGKKFERFFFGDKEVLIPIFKDISAIPHQVKDDVTYFLNLSSGRRVLKTTVNALDHLPNLIGTVLFAENVPERHSLELLKKSWSLKKWIIGPSSVGLIIPNIIKLGAIGGVAHEQITQSKLTKKGKIAVLSSSGGMTNELINIVSKTEIGISFSLSFGGDLFPILSPSDALLAAQKDKSTELILYFGELGGNDEAEIANLVKSGIVTKPIIAYIAGSVSRLFKEPPQFGHAKAIANTNEESAEYKRSLLSSVGVRSLDSFSDLVTELEKIAKKTKPATQQKTNKINELRKKSYFISSISHKSPSGELLVVGSPLSEIDNHSIGEIIAMITLGKKVKSKKTSDLIELSIKLLADHGPHVSGAINTAVSARAGKDLVSSLASGLLTIGPRFGGAINLAAGHWFNGVTEQLSPRDFVESMASKNALIEGIGHKKYRIDNPDPRVKKIELIFSGGKYFKFAKEVEKITVQKSGNLILNVDGAIAAALLDTLEEDEQYSQQQIKELIDIEFFNAMFVIARTIGFTGHYLDQRKIDEGLFRLSEDDVSSVFIP
jgi:ATP citrate (pro-S)-lyase